MTKKQAEQDFKQSYAEHYGSFENAIRELGYTTIRCCWCDYVDNLNKDKVITDKQAFNWGQITISKTTLKRLGYHWGI